MTHVRKIGLWGLAFVCLLAGCSTSVQKVPLSSALSVPNGVGAKAIQYRSAPDALSKGDVVGISRFGVLCLPGKPLAWRDGRVNPGDSDFAESFRAVMERAKFATVAEPGALPEALLNPQADFLLTGQIVSLNVDACSPGSVLGNWRDARGGAQLKVQWRLYSLAQKKVLYETTTEGSYHTDDSVLGGAAELVRNAFAAATQNLLADAAFYRSVHEGDPPMQAGAGPSPAVEASKVEATPASGATVHEQKSAVYTVIAGMSRGRGFVVSADGHLLTSERVVRGYHLVKLKSVSGRESLGFVVRRDEQSDVALVQLTERNSPTLTLRKSPAVFAGEEVHVMNLAAVATDAGVRRGTVSMQKDALSTRLVQTTVSLYAQDAGAPFFDKEGRVVGVALAPIDGRTQPMTGGFVPISEVLSRLALSFR
jgi:S1-C subfamily serine protease